MADYDTWKATDPLQDLEPDCSACRDSGLIHETEFDHDRVVTFFCSCPLGVKLSDQANAREAAATAASAA